MLGPGTQYRLFPHDGQYWMTFLKLLNSLGEPPLVFPGYSAVQTEKALAEDTRRRECPHDVVGLHAHNREHYVDVK